MVLRLVDTKYLFSTIGGSHIVATHRSLFAGALFLFVLSTLARVGMTVYTVNSHKIDT